LAHRARGDRPSEGRAGEETRGVLMPGVPRARLDEDLATS
jgi:hypothetical protein